MIDVTLLLVPVLVIPIILLFRFVGCAQIAGLGEGVDPGVPPPPKYRDYIMSDPSATAPGTVRAHPEVHPNRADVIAYWRLIEGAPSADPHADHTTAADEKGFQNGFYFSGRCAHEEPSASQPGAEESAASPSNDFSFGNPSLIVSDPLQSCRGFNGGSVVVQSTNDLYPQQFTIEAWVWPQWGSNRDLDWEHTLFFGHFEPPSDPGAAPLHGFSVVADRTGHWQVRLNDVGDLFPSPPLATHGKTHLAVTFAKEGSKTRVRLFVNGKEVLPASGLVDYSAPVKGSLFIGVAVKPSGPTPTTVPHRPLIGLIQEVVLHRKALSADEIANHVDINRVD